jgi:hypothetical protein
VADGILCAVYRDGGTAHEFRHDELLALSYAPRTARTPSPTRSGKD